MLGRDVPSGGPVVGAEHDDVGFVLEGQPGEAVGRGGTYDDAGVDGQPVQAAGAAVEYGLRLALLELLARVIALDAVAHVGQGQRSAGGGQEATEHQRVVIARRVVVGDDRPRWHEPSSPDGRSSKSPDSSRGFHLPTISTSEVVHAVDKLR